MGATTLQSIDEQAESELFHIIRLVEPKVPFGKISVDDFVNSSHDAFRDFLYGTHFFSSNDLENWLAEWGYKYGITRDIARFAAAHEREHGAVCEEYGLTPVYGLSRGQSIVECVDRCITLPYNIVTMYDLSLRNDWTAEKLVEFYIRQFSIPSACEIERKKAEILREKLAQTKSF